MTVQAQPRVVEPEPHEVQQEVHLHKLNCNELEKKR
jgi:hypothetical protein